MTVPKRPSIQARGVVPVHRAVQRKTSVAVPAPYSQPKRAIVDVPKPFIPVQTKAVVQPATLFRNKFVFKTKAIVQRARPFPAQVPVFVPARRGAIVQRAEAKPKSTIPPDRYPRPMAEEDVEAMASFHKLGEDPLKVKDALAKIGVGLYSLTPLINSVNCNCFAWAMGNNYFEYPGAKLSTWKHRFPAKLFSEPPADNATVILWGIDSDDITHASVLLTHEELLKRAKLFSLDIEKDLLKRQLKEIGNPCWTSAAGSGFGIYIHPKDWFEGGEFGKALAGMR